MAGGTCGFRIAFDDEALFDDGGGWTDNVDDLVNPMSLQTLGDLRQAVVAWLARPDLESRVDEFIAIGESRFNREIRVQLLENRLAVTVCDPSLAIPPLFRGVRAFRLDKAPGGRINYLSPEQFDDRFGASSSGVPSHFTIVNRKFYFGPRPAGQYEGVLYYWRGVQPLTDELPTNDMLLYHPDLYLYGSLVAAEQYMHNEPRFAMWRAEYDRVIADIKAEDRRDRVSGSALSMTSRRRERV